ncbi:hypothetical protein K435DRAFT_774860 [Dendrothele bispora CBS 962.96]|uniref:Uncharacterized protein n=1 Tax=Dendrothele bispora (strain CBS 962.96) TaxID=1314807 RepID=A0A4S8MLL1_DENBC|nr:hypothetical protein K435DRAFT_774860 [Dendrothele bispora CBS 962.96]
MDSDRKSTVSSFYGRKNSMDALNNDFPSPSLSERDRYGQQGGYGRGAAGGGGGGGGGGRDDASSFFQPNADFSNNAPRSSRPVNSAGYNRNSFFFAGREEPLKGGRDEEEDVGGGGAGGGFDIYADFNNAGPKYSTSYNSDGYQALPGGHANFPQPGSPTPGTSTPKNEGDATYSSPFDGGGQVELVTVPALGPEWRKEEMKGMTKKAKREKKNDKRREALRAWNRGERGICGKWFTKRMLVVVMFVTCVVIGIILAFTVPRVPSFSFNSDHPLANATGDWADAVPIHFERLPANFTFPAFADLRIDTGNNYLPLHFNNLIATVLDSETGKEVGHGDLGSYTIPAKSLSEVLVPLNFTYTAVNFTDPTWENWHDACQNAAVSQGGVRPGLNFRLVIEMHIAGLVGTRSASTQVANAACPIELPQNAG